MLSPNREETRHCLPKQLAPLLMIAIIVYLLPATTPKCNICFKNWQLSAPILMVLSHSCRMLSHAICTNGFVLLLFLNHFRPKAALAYSYSIRTPRTGGRSSTCLWLFEARHIRLTSAFDSANFFCHYSNLKASAITTSRWSNQTS